MDIYPTLAQLAGLPLPEALEGTSFAPLLDNPDQPGKKAALSQFPRGAAMGRSMRTDRYRFTLWQNRRGAKETVGVELYDHQDDPDENENLTVRPEHAALVKRLRAELEQHWGKTNSTATQAR